MLSFPASRASALLFGIMLAAFRPCGAQDTTFHGPNGAKAASLKDCAYYTVSGPDPAAPERYKAFDTAGAQRSTGLVTP